MNAYNLTDLSFLPAEIISLIYYNSQTRDLEFLRFFPKLSGSNWPIERSKESPAESYKRPTVMSISNLASCSFLPLSEYIQIVFFSF